MESEATESLSVMRKYFRSGATRPFEFRERQLQILLQRLREMEPELLEALVSDLGRPEYEGFAAELGFLYEEIRFTLKHLRAWMKDRRVPGGLAAFPSRSYIRPEPKGVVLILAPWNYPVQLLLGPLVGALSAGNCAILKPSEFAPKTSSVLKNLISSAFPSELVRVLEGDAEFTRGLLRNKFDHVFFTGSTEVGRKVMVAAAQNLTPVTLELGGKSPCIVDGTSDPVKTAQRIVWGKFFNAGQTCIAPDYIAVRSSFKKPLVDALKAEMARSFGDRPLESLEYGKIVNRTHFDRIKAYLDHGQVLVGGAVDERALKIEPTVIGDVPGESPLAREEIFGPILPVFEWREESELYDLVEKNPDPLALYVFSDDERFVARVLEALPSGGVCVNDTLMHLVNPHLPFGGVGSSGMGAYHGRYSFDTFSHFRAVMHRPWWPEVPFRFRPYRNHVKWLRRLFA